MPEPPVAPETSIIVDSVLKKYVRVWLWSILFGTGTWLLFAAGLSLSGSGRSGLVGAVLSAASLVAAALSWVDLFRAFQVYLLPVFITSTASSDADGLALFGRYLRRAFLLLIVAVLARACVPVIDALSVGVFQF